ncbi:Putative carboxypeptidase YodJ [Pseudoclavibacter triregionum]|nr:Putative carboxypeptidase YodJ [Pseudoclavibacter triregionum]
MAWVVTSLLAIGALGVSWLGVNQILHGAPIPGAVSATGVATPTQRPTPTLAMDVSTPSSPSVLVGPQFPIAPLDYAPADLVELSSISVPAEDGVLLEHDAAYALLHLFADARYVEGFELSVAKGYVSVAEQAKEYEEAVASMGEDAARTQVGEPGHDEHQTGYAADLALEGSDCSLKACFATTDAGEWLAEHAADYGFIVRYPAGSSSATGVADRPFQLRYVGDELAAQIAASGKPTYEEYLGLPPLG